MREESAVNRPTSTEAVSALMTLAMNRVDIRAIERITSRLPEIARRPQEYCPSGNPRECRVFGVTWWSDNDTYGNYRVCVSHNWAEGPMGPLARKLPLARPDSPDDALEEAHRHRAHPRAMTLVPHVDRIAWAITEGDTTIGCGSEALPSVNDDVLGGIATWLAQVLRSYEPDGVLITDRFGADNQQEDNAVTAIGIRMRTRDLESPAEGPMGFLLAERMIGTLYGVASTTCPGAVYLSGAYEMSRSGEISSEPSNPALTEAFASALVVATAHYDKSDESSAATRSDRAKRPDRATQS